MDIKALDASSAYVQALKRAAEPGAPGGDRVGAVGGSSFAELLGGIIDEVVKSGKASEAATMGAAVRQGEIVSVVTAVASAEIALQTVVAVRDQAMQAYQDIMRMPI
jgi:flagellar hook-basal body complex protein FliE